MNYLPSDYLPILIQLGLAVGFIVLTMIVTHSIGPKRNSKLKDDPFECGIDVQGNAGIVMTLLLIEKCTPLFSSGVKDRKYTLKGKCAAQQCIFQRIFAPYQKCSEPQ